MRKWAYLQAFYDLHINKNRLMLETLVTVSFIAERFYSQFLTKQSVTHHSILQHRMWLITVRYPSTQNVTHHSILQHRMLLPGVSCNVILLPFAYPLKHYRYIYMKETQCNIFYYLLKPCSPGLIYIFICNPEYNGNLNGSSKFSQQFPLTV